METQRDPDPAPEFNDRRIDLVTADIVHVGVIFMNAFGEFHVHDFFNNTDVPPHVYWRLILGVVRSTDNGILA